MEIAFDSMPMHAHRMGWWSSETLCLFCARLVVICEEASFADNSFKEIAIQFSDSAKEIHNSWSRLPAGSIGKKGNQNRCTLVYRSNGEWLVVGQSNEFDKSKFHPLRPTHCIGECQRTMRTINYIEHRARHSTAKSFKQWKRKSFNRRRRCGTNRECCPAAANHNKPNEISILRCDRRSRWLKWFCHQIKCSITRASNTKKIKLI